MKIGVPILAAFLLLASPALAQKTPDPAPAASTREADGAETIAAARAHAERLIERASADGLFVNITTTRTPRVQHIRSGLMCEFDIGEADQITLFDPGAAAPGDDVGCNTYVSAHGALVTVYATRYRSGGLDTHYEDAVGEIRQRYDTLTVWTGRASTEPLPDGAPRARHARYIATEAGETTYTRLSIAEVGEWTVMMRFSSTPQDAERLDGAASRVFALAVSSVMGGPLR